jgi:hypothetical protein
VRCSAFSDGVSEGNEAGSHSRITAPVTLLARSLAECGDMASPMSCTSEAISAGPRAMMIETIAGATDDFGMAGCGCRLSEVSGALRTKVGLK